MTSTQSDNTYAMRHSYAHIMATAIQELFPDAMFGVGPVIDHGFYYDVDLEKAISTADLESISAKMQEIVAADYEFQRSTMPVDDAMDYFASRKQDYKVELLRDLKSHGTTVFKDIDRSQIGLDEGSSVDEVSIYTDGPFTDLCRGPHVDSTGRVGVFKLTNVAGAYWRGDDKNKQMQRVYGLAFATAAELDHHLAMLEEAENRDHRKLGRELDLFVFSDLVGPGLPLWTPRGTILRIEVDKYVQELRHEHGYLPVAIPHVTKKDLYEKSGHWHKFKDELFKITTREGNVLAMKPMNCPHHTQIYASRPRSYRELPIRYRETTMVYRDEQSGELSGLSRVRSITQDDAHVFCRSSQIQSEMLKIWDIVERFWNIFGIELNVRLSTHDPADMTKYLGREDQWTEAVSQLRQVIESKQVDYVDGVGDAAFYGPKIDFIGKDALGREFQASTIQLDFGQPEGFDLNCTNEAGESERIVMIHCAVAGSLERCLVLLIEHYAGAFPVWLAPEQVRIATVSDEYIPYAESIMEQLLREGVRADLDDSRESVGKKIRSAELAKIPYTVIVGDKERESGVLTPRVRRDLAVAEAAKTYGVAQFIQTVAHESKSRTTRSSL